MTFDKIWTKYLPFQLDNKESIFLNVLVCMLHIKFVNIFNTTS
jgi:hypothetical protein